MKPKTISLPRYYVTYFINCHAPGFCPLPRFVEVTDMYVKVLLDDPKLTSLYNRAEWDASNAINSTVKKSAQRTLEKLDSAKLSKLGAVVTHQTQW